MAKRKINKTIDKGRIYITSTFNNTLVTVTDEKGNPVVCGSCGMYGFSGTRKPTPYAAMITTSTTLKKAIVDYGLRSADVFVKGIGPGRESALRAVKDSDIEVYRIIDITPIPHNGVRAPKVRRV